MRATGQIKQLAKDPDVVDASLRIIYDFYRTSLLNAKYFGLRLRQANLLYVSSEWVILAGSATSGVSGWAIWTYGFASKDAWLIIAAISTLISASKPILQLNKRIERYSRLFAGHNSIYLSMIEVVNRIEIRQEVNQDIEREYAQLYKKFVDLSKDDDPSPPNKLVERLASEVIEQIPSERLWWPKCE